MNSPKNFFWNYGRSSFRVPPESWAWISPRILSWTICKDFYRSQSFYKISKFPLGICSGVLPRIVSGASPKTFWEVPLGYPSKVAPANRHREMFPHELLVQFSFSKKLIIEFSKSIFIEFLRFFWEKLLAKFSKDFPEEIPKKHQKESSEDLVEKIQKKIPTTFLNVAKMIRGTYRANA